MQRRRAISLVELSVAMSVSTVVLAVAVGLVHRVMIEQKRARVDHDLHRVAERLSQRFRQDIHLTRQVLPRPENTGELIQLQLQFSSGDKVEYEFTGNVASRTQTDQSGQILRDEFAFPAACHIELVNDAASGRIALQVWLGQQPIGTGALTDSAVPAVAPKPVVHVDAVVGRDVRFEPKADGGS